MANPSPARGLDVVRKVTQRYRRARGAVNEAAVASRGRVDGAGAGPLGALIVLGCRVSAEGRPSDALARRIAGAAQAYSAGLAPLVVASGGARWSGVAEADVIRRELIAAGVPEASVLVELLSRSTFENARACARVLGSMGISAVGVVTCDWHMARAVALFARHGFDVRPLPCASPPLGLARRSMRHAREAAARLLTMGWHRA